jgi:carbon storage regulator
MLVLSRKPGEKIVIGGDITVSVVEVHGDRVRLAFEAPAEVRILRAELTDRRPRTAVAEGDPDPDLAAKPAEWSEVQPDITRTR